VRRVLPALAAVGAIALVIGLAYAGSPSRIAEGVQVAGVDVGGLKPADARKLLGRKARALFRVPVRFTADGRTWRLTPAQLAVKVDWDAAVGSALREGSGTGPFRGFRRIDVRLFGVDLAPPTAVYRPALDYELKRIGAAVDGGHREASIRLRGLTPEIVPGRTGGELDRGAAAATIVRALSRLSRDPVALPVRVDAPRVTADDLRPVAAQVRTALSAPVRLALGPTRWRVKPRRLAQFLDLPRDGRRELSIGGRAANAWFAHLGRRAGRPARDADFAVYSNGVRIIPSRDGYEVDVPRSARALLKAALSPMHRTARLVVVRTHPARTTQEARAMGIVGVVGAYTTVYGGEPNRIHNVQLVAQLIDKHLIAPGATFSFNRTTGARTADKGFKEAPVIINGELKTGLGGGVCQVSTTVFNAAYEAGLEVTQRTNHALYISHYPTGRDATVDYPDVDLKFVNDTPHWLLLRTWVGPSSLTVALYGTPQHRRIVTTTAPLVERAAAPLKRIADPTLTAGERVVEESGEPARSTSVHRLVYDAGGKLLHDDTWTSYYRAEPEVVRVGTKRKPKPKKPQPAQTTSTATTTTTSTTTPQPR
jgi:vancomycin resistance protein YoaR